MKGVEKVLDDYFGAQFQDLDRRAREATLMEEVTQVGEAYRELLQLRYRLYAVLHEPDKGKEEDDDDDDDEEWEDEYDRKALEKFLGDTGKRKVRSSCVEINYSAAADLEQYYAGPGVDRGVQGLMDTQYGRTLYDRLMQVAMDTGYHTKDSPIKDHFRELLLSIDDATITYRDCGMAQCYLCNARHECNYIVSYFGAKNQTRRYPIGRNCKRVAQQVLDLATLLLRGPRQPDGDYEEWHEEIEDQFLLLQEVHMDKNKKKRKT